MLPFLRRRDDFAADADDFGVAGAEIIGKVGVVLFAMRRRHQHTDVFADDLGAW